MNQFCLHIETLLLNHSCVIVPNLGGFVAQDCPSRYDAEEQIFLPPTRSVAFNPLLKINDGLLAQSYMLAEGVSFEQALSAIDRAVLGIQQEIAERGEYILHGIGTLTRTSDGAYDFTPCEEGLLSPMTFAFENLQISPLHKEEKENKFSFTFVRKDEPKEVRNRSWGKWAVAAVVLVLLTFFWTAPLSLRKQVVQQEEAAVLQEQLSDLTNKVLSSVRSRNGERTPLSEEKTTATTLSQVVKPFSAPSAEVAHLVAKEKNAFSAQGTTQEQTTSPQQKLSSNGLSLLTDKTAPEGEYTIVLASKVTKTGAETMLHELLQNGQKDVAIANKNGVIRVVCGRYAQYSTATEALQTLRKQNPAFADAWILREKK